MHISYIMTKILCLYCANIQSLYLYALFVLNHIDSMHVVCYNIITARETQQNLIQEVYTMKTYIIVNSKGEQLGTIQAASTTLLNRIVRSVYGRDAKAVEA